MRGFEIFCVFFRVSVYVRVLVSGCAPYVCAPLLAGLFWLTVSHDHPGVPVSRRYTVTNEAGESGMIPAAVLGPLGTAKPGALGYRMATDVFEATADDELGLNVDDIVEVLENDDANWWQGRNVETGAVGMFPQGQSHMGGKGGFDCVVFFFG